MGKYLSKTKIARLLNRIKSYVIPLSDKGKADGVATLGSDGKLTNGQLPTIDLGSIDFTVEELAAILLNNGGKCAWRCTVTQSSGGKKLPVGTLDMFSDSSMHQVTQVLTSNFVVSSDGSGFGSHMDNCIHTYSRMFNLNAAHPDGVAQGTWGPWKTHVTASAEENGLMSAEDKALLDFYNGERSGYIDIGIQGKPTYSEDKVGIGYTRFGALDDIENNPVEINAATPNSAGVMSAGDKVKLNELREERTCILAYTDDFEEDSFNYLPNTGETRALSETDIIKIFGSDYHDIFFIDKTDVRLEVFDNKRLAVRSISFLGYLSVSALIADFNSFKVIIQCSADSRNGGKTFTIERRSETATDKVDGLMSVADKAKLDKFVFGPTLVTAVGNISILNSSNNSAFRSVIAAACKAKTHKVIYGDTNGNASATYTCVVGDKGTVTLTLQGGGVGAWYKDMNSLAGVISNDMITFNGFVNSAQTDVSFSYELYE